MIAFGPVPSRRLRRSLGINNISGIKSCSYSCIYCQVGLRCRMTGIRQTFYKPEHLASEVFSHLALLGEEDKPDYLTFVSNGEPTLDIHLGEAIGLLQATGIPVAVITNGSLLSDPRVREDLFRASWVSVKVDTGTSALRKVINRPIPALGFDAYVEGLLDFSAAFSGHLVTETMLVSRVNDATDQLIATARLITRISPETAYLSIPTRPPAISSVSSPPEEALVEAYRVYTDAGLSAELITGFEGTSVAHTGNAREDVLNILGVHPLREDALRELLRKNGSDGRVVRELIRKELIREVKHGEHLYYLRKFTKP